MNESAAAAAMYGGHDHNTPSIPSKTLKDRVRFAMERAGLSQVELADRAGVTRSTVSNWLLGRSASVKTNVAGSLAKALNVSAEWLMYGTGDIDQPTPVGVPAEAIGFAKLLHRLDDDQKGMLESIVNAIDSYTSGARLDETDIPNDPPGVDILTRAYRMLETERFRDRFDALPPDAKATLLATLCSMMQDDDIEDAEGEIEGVLRVCKHLRRPE